MEHHGNIPTDYINLANMVGEYLYRNLPRHHAEAGLHGFFQFLNAHDRRHLEDVTVNRFIGGPENMEMVVNNLGDTVIFAINRINARRGPHEGVTANSVARILIEENYNDIVPADEFNDDDDGFGVLKKKLHKSKSKKSKSKKSKSKKSKSNKSKSNKSKSKKNKPNKKKKKTKRKR